MKATRADVARLAGVSTATVSYVLNGSRNMSEKTKKRVFDAVEQLNYKPDMIARSMTKNETMQLALIVNDITNPFYGEIMMGFEKAAICGGYFVNVCTGYQNINEYFENYIARRVDGVFVVAVPNKFNVEKLYKLADNGIQVVVSGNAEADVRKVSCIENDYIAGMQMAVQHLYDLGHREIVYLSGFNKAQSFDKRISGYMEALESVGLTYGDRLLLEGKPPYLTGMEDGHRLATELMTSGKSFTAVICTNDLMAMGAISAFESAGLRVPQDVSVMGFDDIMFSSVWRPSISTVAASKTNFGQKAFELLHNSIKQKSTEYYLSPMELKVRTSTGKKEE